MRIRKAKGEEMLSLWGYEAGERLSPTARFFYENIASGNTVFCTLEHDGALIGELYVFLDMEDGEFANGTDRAYLCAFRVKEGYRGKGLGTILMDHVLADMKENGIRTATIAVSPDEPQNVRLYRRMGFERKIRECFYDPCGFDREGKPLYEESGWWLLAKEL